MTPDLEIQDLPDSEEKVMLALWRCGGEASFYQIQLALEGERWLSLIHIFSPSRPVI